MANANGKITWTNERRKLSELIPWPRNPRQIKTDQAKRLVESFDQFGQVETIAIGPDGDIYNGHQRLNVLAEKYGKDYEIEVRVSDRALSEKEREKLTIFLHKGAAGEWDFDTLANEFELDDLLEWGMDKKELDLDLWAGPVQDDPGAQMDKAEELREKWGVQSGQLWKLGEHRLICGDCTDRAVVERVMMGEKARLIFTSPPYYDQRTYKIGEFDWLELAKGFFNILPIGNPSDVLVNLGLSHKDGRVNRYWDDWLSYCEDLGFPLYDWYVWDKGRGFPGDYHGRLALAHEFIFHFSIGHGQANKWIDKSPTSFERNKYKKTTMQRERDGSFQPIGSPETIHQLTKIPDSVIRMPQETDTQNHPAVFPVEFPEFGIKTWGDPGSIVYEPFSGSGTTLIACERLGRCCRAIEISAPYVAVAIQRWVDMTGGIPEQVEYSRNEQP